MASSNSFTQFHSSRHIQTSTRSTKRSVTRASVGTSYPEATALDYRRVLGVGPNASKRDVKAAYRRLALQYHPDVCRVDECDTRFMEVNRAYESLMSLMASSGYQPPQADAAFSYNYCSQAAESAPTAEEDDPWADFLQSLVTGTYEEMREESPYDYSRYSTGGRSTHGTSSPSFDGNW